MVRRETDVGLAARDRQFASAASAVFSCRLREYVERLALWQDAREPGGPTGELANAV